MSFGLNVHKCKVISTLHDTRTCLKVWAQLCIKKHSCLQLKFAWRETTLQQHGGLFLIWRQISSCWMYQRHDHQMSCRVPFIDSSNHAWQHRRSQAASVTLNLWYWSVAKIPSVAIVCNASGLSSCI